MHELAVCQSMITQLTEISAHRGCARVARVEVRVGPLSGVEPDLLARAFPLASAGTVAAGAELCVTTLDVRVACTRCGQESRVSPNRLVCDACGDFRTRLISGDELVLARVELETEPACATPLG